MSWTKEQVCEESMDGARDNTNAQRPKVWNNLVESERERHRGIGDEW